MPPKQAAPLTPIIGPKSKWSRPTFQEVKPSPVASGSADVSASQVPTDDSSQPQSSKSKRPKFQAVKSQNEPSNIISGGTEVITLSATVKGCRSYRMYYFPFPRLFSYFMPTSDSATLAPQASKSHSLSPTPQVLNSPMPLPIYSEPLLGSNTEVESIPPSKPRNTTKASCLIN